MALWLYATIEGIGGARQLDELCREHSAFQWIAGDVSTNYHTLADFRTDHVELLDDLLTKSVATLMAEGLVELNRVAQDGMRVRAGASMVYDRIGAGLLSTFDQYGSFGLSTQLTNSFIPSASTTPKGEKPWRSKPALSFKLMKICVDRVFGCDVLA